MTEIRTTVFDGVGPNGWSICDEVMQLREWGTRVSYPFPPQHEAVSIGAARNCWIRIRNPDGSVSRTHAVLSYSAGGWTLADLGSKNGVFLDGMRVSVFPVVAGAEIRIGTVTLVAESPKLIALRALLERLIGWADDRLAVVDQALFSLRVAVTHREPLLLCGEGNLVPIARQLHQRALAGRPFVVAKPRTRHTRGMDALAEAAGGTLCVWRREQIADFDEVASALQSPYARALLMVCAHDPPAGNDIVSRIVSSGRSIVFPPMAGRMPELRRIIESFAAEAIAELGGGWLEPADRRWIEQHASASLQLVGMTTRRIVALHLCEESVTRAAKLLAMSHGALSDWLARRSLAIGYS